MTIRAHLAITVVLLAPVPYMVKSFAGEFSEQPAAAASAAKASTAKQSNSAPTSTLQAQRKQSTAMQSNTELLTDELRDTEARRHDELGARVSDIEAQAETIRQLTQRQAEYIKQLKAKIDAIKAQGTAE